MNKVKSLFAFGSILKESFNEASDIDLVVEIDDNNPLSYSEKYFNLKFQLEKLFNRNIDLLEERSLKNPYLKSEIDKTKVLVYGE